jgi:poly-gamma-glutamate capsule biosynthesis protein CapA/YwtB (metallophosphatase superfamily)
VATWSRRQFVQCMAGLPLAGAASCGLERSSAPTTARITLAGQALMTWPLCEDPYPGLDEVIAELSGGAAVFTDLEAVIETPQSGKPTRDGEFLHVAPLTVLSCIRQMGFNLLALANNHAWDLGTEGILATRAEVAAAGFGAAGTGSNLAEATAPGMSPGMPRVALVSMATGKIREGAAATATRAGVNELRMTGGGLDERDVGRNLAAVSRARGNADYVIACLHNHQWGEDMALTQPWAREFAKRCVEAGADVFVSHGAPLLHGMEIYRGKALLHGLGSLVFHTRTAPGHYPADCWESAIVHCDFEGPRLAGVSLVPVVLNEVGDDPARPLQTRGRPRLAARGDRARILGRLAGLSAALGTTLRYDGSSARIEPA